jgi:hypothetical protein
MPLPTTTRVRPSTVSTRVAMDVLTFGYRLMYEPGDRDENPIGPAEAPLNLMAVAVSTGPLLAVVWDWPTETWTFQPDVAAAILYRNPDDHRTRRVDRTTAEREALRFATTPLPTEQQLTEICRAGRPA